MGTWTEGSIEDRIRQILTERLRVPVESSALRRDTGLVDDVGLDSSGLLELVLGLEEAFSIEVQDEDVADGTFESIGSLTRYVAARPAEQRA